MYKLISYSVIVVILLACNSVENSKNEVNNNKSKETKLAVIPVKYFETQKDSVTENYFGTEVNDPYRWLENDTSSATKQWVKKQNEITFGYLNQIPFRDKIKTRVEEILNYPKQSAPRKVGEYYFYTKNDGLQDQSVYYYKKGEDGEEQVFIDPNKESETGIVAISLLGASPDDKYIAYSRQEAGSDWQEIRVREIATNKEFKDKVKWAKFTGASWDKDGFFYSGYEAPKEGSEYSAKNVSHSVYYHELGTTQEADKLIYEDENNPKLYHFVGVTEDEKYLILHVQNGTEGVDLYFREMGTDGNFKPLITGFKNKSDVIDHVDGKLYVLTDKNASNNQLVAINVNNVDEAAWETIIPESEHYLSAVSTGGGKLFAQYLEKAASKLFQLDYDGSNKKEIELPTIGSAGGLSGKKDDKDLFYSFSSYTYPSTIFKYNVETGKSEQYFQPDVKFDPSAYETNQVTYKSKDGTNVTMFITHKKGLELNGNNPTLLYGYGGFNISITPWFSPSNMILLENGGVYAVANLRGGAEYGEEWHKDGMLMNKQNVFDDFIAAAQYLIDNKYTCKEKLAIEGRSNGGLLVGAVITQKPDLCQVAFPCVGVLDMLRYHLFTVGWGWVPEYGSSEQSKEMFEYLYGYSPLHNVKPETTYPATMVTTADHDDRVVPAHSFKFAATLQENHIGDNPVLIRIDVDAGHGAGKPLSKQIDEIADKWSFMFYNTNTSLVNE
ncbi:MAG: S9 family peptidase [Flavobacteriales bacterium]|nr:S9 family peptidase [Flavobacteriales bacterium]